MKLLMLLALCATLPNHLTAKDCKAIAQEECKETEYHLYVECVGNRMKRSAECEYLVKEACDDDCEDSCQQCDCDYCAINKCQQSCNSCCPNNPSCSTNRCCHKTCHSRCKSHSCRKSCKKTCIDMVHNGGGSVNITKTEKLRHNVTTIINLHNIINNTNIIDIPTHVNNTNPHTTTEKSTEQIIDNSTTVITNEPCCYVISPKQCVPSEKYPYVRCFHIRKKLCGKFCKASIIHEQPHEICDETPNGTICHQQVAYIPQPQPNCAYHPTWPYVACGVPQQQFCGGCYLHYNSPYPQYPPPGCSPACYDDGYGMGPYYRQGPFYRPGYAHVPSCYQINACTMYNNNNFGMNYGYPTNYGGFGYSPQNQAGFPQFPTVGYPPYTYENNIHFETNPDSKAQAPKLPEKNSSANDILIDESPQVAYYPAPIIPYYSQLGYAYVQPIQPYNLPPEVDIQATISYPKNQRRYAQITISKKHSKRAHKTRSMELKESVDVSTHHHKSNTQKEEHKKESSKHKHVSLKEDTGKDKDVDGVLDTAVTIKVATSEQKSKERESEEEITEIAEEVTSTSNYAENTEDITNNSVGTTENSQLESNEVDNIEVFLGTTINTNTTVNEENTDDEISGMGSTTEENSMEQDSTNGNLVQNNADGSNIATPPKKNKNEELNVEKVLNSTTKKMVTSEEIENNKNYSEEY